MFDRREAVVGILSCQNHLASRRSHQFGRMGVGGIQHNRSTRRDDPADDGVLVFILTDSRPAEIAREPGNLKDQIDDYIDTAVRLDLLDSIPFVGGN